MYLPDGVPLRGTRMLTDHHVCSCFSQHAGSIPDHREPERGSFSGQRLAFIQPIDMTQFLDQSSRFFATVGFFTPSESEFAVGRYQGCFLLKNAERRLGSVPLPSLGRTRNPGAALCGGVKTRRSVPGWSVSHRPVFLDSARLPRVWTDANIGRDVRKTEERITAVYRRY
jgi:hypothetical protein